MGAPHTRRADRHRLDRPPRLTRSYSLDRLDGDESDHWDFEDPAELAATGAALAAGVPVAGSTRYGPWIEQPFVEFLRGERPDGPRRPDRTPAWLHLVAD